MDQYFNMVFATWFLGDIRVRPHYLSAGTLHFQSLVLRKLVFKRKKLCQPLVTYAVESERTLLITVD